MLVVDGLVAGVVTSGPTRDEPAEPPLELMSLYLRAAYHGSGIADEMINRAICDTAASLWVFAKNRRAIAFYVRHGVRPDGEAKTDPGTGVREIRMIR